jgi:hypothetical protein
VSDWFDATDGGATVRLRDVLDSRADDLVAGCIEAGALVSIGMSRDLGSVGVTVTLDGRWRRGWFRDSDDAVVWLEAAVAAVHGAGSSPASSGEGKRQRPRRAT